MTSEKWKKKRLNTGQITGQPIYNFLNFLGNLNIFCMCNCGKKIKIKNVIGGNWNWHIHLEKQENYNYTILPIVLINRYLLYLIFFWNLNGLGQVDLWPVRVG